MKWLWDANLNYQRELARENSIEDMYNIGQLNGAIFKRRMLDTNKIQGLGYFGAVAASYLYFPAVAGILGSNLTMLGMCFSGLMGMKKLDDKEMINSIEWIRDGD